MLHNLPFPKPDELFYSVLARLGARLDLSGKAFNRLIFGEIPFSIALVDLPRRLDLFQSRVPSCHPLATANILHENTLFPLYAPFVTPEMADALAVDIKDAQQRSTVRPVASNIVKTQKGGLRVCPQCLADDLERDGEHYWLRLHRVPGVTVCPTHKLFLITTGVASGGMRSAWNYMVPPDSIIGDAETFSDSKQEHLDMLSIAQFAQWTLSRYGWRVPEGDWGKAYRLRLSELGYKAAADQGNVADFIKEFDSRFSLSFLDRIGGLPTILRPNSGWVRRLISLDIGVHPPWRHYMLWIMLGLTAEQIPELLERVKKRENPQSPSLSPMKRPASSSEFRALLESLWQDTSISFVAACELLGAKPATVRRHVRILGLPLPKSSSGEVKPSPRQRAPEILDAQKAQWLELCAKYPNLSSTELQAKDQNLYSRVAYSDPVWMQHHLPKSRRALTNKSSDWGEQDDILLAKLATEHKKMIQQPGFPEKISINSFVRTMGQPLFVTRRLKKSPNSRKFLDIISETPVQYAMRCLRHVAAELRAGGREVLPYELRTVAKVSNLLASDPLVREIIVGLCGS